MVTTQSTRSIYTSRMLLQRPTQAELDRMRTAEKVALILHKFDVLEKLQGRVEALEVPPDQEK